MYFYKLDNDTIGSKHVAVSVKINFFIIKIITLDCFKVVHYVH